MSIPLVAHLSPKAKCSNEDEEKSNMAIIFDKYKGRLATLPKDKGWFTNVYMYQGFWYESMSILSVESVIALKETFKAQSTDIFLVTMPKSGTTWLKALMFDLTNRYRYKKNDLSAHPLLVSNPHVCMPSIGVELFRNTLTDGDVGSPRLFAAHIPYNSLPQSILDSGCRLVYLCRNPKDVFVSTFHFANKLRGKSHDPVTLEEAFKLFSKGITPYVGPFWDHVKGYHKASLECPNNVFFLTYEDMMKDTVNIVKRLAEFLGCTFTDEEEAEGTVQGIIKLCSFENLSKVNKHGNFLLDVPNESFFRKGKVGDWTNHLTDETSRVIDEISEEKFHGLNISF